MAFEKKDNLSAVFNILLSHQELPMGVVIYRVEEKKGKRRYIFEQFSQSASRIEQKDHVLNKEVSTVFPGIKELGLLDVFDRVYQTGNAEVHQIHQYHEKDLGDVWRQNWVYRLPSKKLLVFYTDETDIFLSRQRYKSLVEQIPLGVFQAQPDGKLLTVNPALCDLFAAEKDCQKFIKSHKFSDLLVSSEQAQQFLNKLKQSSGQALKNEEVKFQKINHEYFLASVDVYQRDDHIFGIIRDITKEKKLENQLLHARKMESVGTFAGGIAHDFGNLINIMMTYGQMAKSECGSDSVLQEYLSEVQTAGKRALELVHQILVFAKEKEIKKYRLNVAKLLYEVTTLIRSELPKNVEIVTHVSDDVPLIKANPIQIHQVLMNLCVNAAHAMENKSGQLKISLRPVEYKSEEIFQLPSGKYLEIKIIDNGQGIEKKTVERIFDPYFTTKKGRKGSGLGLSVVHGIVEDHHGYIFVDSAVGQGTAFYLFFPVLTSMEHRS